MRRRFISAVIPIVLTAAIVILWGRMSTLAQTQTCTGKCVAVNCRITAKYANFWYEDPQAANLCSFDGSTTASVVVVSGEVLRKDAGEDTYVVCATCNIPLGKQGWAAYCSSPYDNPTYVDKTDCQEPPE
jgi:hypothetical protein